MIVKVFQYHGRDDVPEGDADRQATEGDDDKVRNRTTKTERQSVHGRGGNSQVEDNNRDTVVEQAFTFDECRQSLTHTETSEQGYYSNRISRGNQSSKGKGGWPWNVEKRTHNRTNNERADERATNSESDN